MEASALRRQAEVLGEGLSEGFSDILSTTWSDLRKAGGSFVDHPLDTTGTYLKNHWQDAVAGAVISIVNPRGFANAMLLGWSMRGLGVAAMKAVSDAADPNADLSAVKADLKDAVSHEGTAFLAAMPMAMAGSMVGRAGANAVFGRNKVGYDFLRGDVSKTVVRENLLKLRDRVIPPEVKTVITDLDGTTYGFNDYFAPAIRDAVPDLAKKMGMTEPQVYKALGSVMDARRTHDWPWVLEESELARRFKGTPAEFRAQIVEPYYAHMDSYMAKYLRPYEGVLETLAELKARGIKVYALSDAPLFIAKARATQTGVANYLDGLWALETVEPPVSAVGGLAENLAHGRARVKNFLDAPSPVKDKMTAVAKHFEKPETGGILMVFSRDPEVRPSQRVFTGDSRVKDGGVSHAVGIHYLRARYGSVIAPEYENVMNTLRPDFGISGAAKVKIYPPQLAETASYADILKYIEPKADYGALTKSALSSLSVPPRPKALMGFNLFPYQTSDRQSN